MMSKEGNKMDTDEEKGSSNKDLIHEMMHNEDFKLFFKTIMKEAVKEENTEYRERISELEKQVCNLNEENEKMKGDMHELKCSNEKLEQKNTSLQSQADNLQSEVELRSMVLEDLQQYSRRNCVLVTGVPEEKDENTDELIKHLSTDKLKVPLADEDIDRSHRVGKPKTKGKARAIIVKFTRHNKKTQIIKARRKLRGSNIGIQEQLTTFKLFFLEKARKLVKMSTIAKAAWTWDGRVTVLVQPSDKVPGKKVTINRIEDLNDIWKQGLNALQDRQKVPVGKALDVKADFDSSDSEKD